MKILAVVLKELLQAVRDIKTLIIMIFMPTLLTLILGITFEDTFISSIDLSEIKVNYMLNCNEEEKNFFNEFVNVAKELNINIEEISNDEHKYKQVIKENNIGSGEEKILIYVNNLYDIEVLYNRQLESSGAIVMSLLDTVIDRHRVMGIALHNGGDGAKLKGITEENFINIESLNGKSAPSSMDYYGVVMITMTIMFGAVIGAYGIIKERDSNTLGKILTLPISPKAILFGKIIGASLIMFIQIGVAFCISNFIGVYWGKNIISVLLLLFSEGILAIAFGIAIGYFIRDNKSAWMVLLLIIMISGFLGGAFIPLELIDNNLVNVLSEISPLAYINKSIFQLIYSGRSILANYCIMLNIIVSITLITFLSFVMEVKN